MVRKRIAYGSFYLAVVIEVLIVIVDKSAYINPFEGRLFQITFLLFALKTALTRYSRKEYLTVFLFLLLGAISYFVTGRNEIVRLIMFIAACKDVDMVRCLKLVFYLTLAGCTVIILLSVIGIYGAVSLAQDYGRGSMETRYTLGMGHPNALQCMVWALTTLGLYLYGERMRWYSYLFVAVINVGFFLLTDSRTSLLITMFVMVLAYIVKMGNRIWNKIIGVGCMAVTLISIIGSVVIAANAYRVYNYAWFGWDDEISSNSVTMFFVKLDRILTGRIRVLTENDEFTGTIDTWRLFSRPENDYYFDMGWIRLFYWYGIIPACIFVVALIVMMYYCYRKEHYMALVLIASFSIYTIIEAHAISVYLARNYVFFLMGMYWSMILQETEELRKCNRNNR